MNNANAMHPSPEQLTAFGLGRLPPALQAEIERHITGCDACCAALRQVSDDTLTGRLRQMNTSIDTPAPAKAAVPGNELAVPPELADHPRYRILKVLGTGGMGIVYQAEHRLMERPVALKVISPNLVNNSVAVQRFRQEARAAARLAHPNIVTAYDAEQAGELQILVMEFIDGISLARLVEKRGPLPVAQACQFIRQAALGLQHAHVSGMVHRDIKPQNLMLTRKGQVKVLDFGLARLRGQGQGPPREITKLGTVLGTPDYIAPEQASDSRTVDIRADIYSLGCTLYFLLTGQPPFPRGSTTEKLLLHLEAIPIPLTMKRPDVPVELAALVSRMMAKDPAERYQTPEEVARALVPFAKGTAPPAGPQTTEIISAKARVVRRSSSLRRHRRSVVVVALVLALGAAVAGKAFRTLRQDHTLSPVREEPKDNKPSLAREEPNDIQPALARQEQRETRVAFLLPSKQFWYPDYAPVRRILEKGGVKVTVISSVRGEVRHDPDGGGSDVAVDQLLNDVNPEDFDAVVVAGGRGVGEYLSSSPSGPSARRLMDEMWKRGKYVTALCMGTGVLNDMGFFKNKSVTAPSWARRKIQEMGGILVDEAVVVDDRLITGRSFEDAERFAETLLDTLRKKTSR